MKKIVFSGLMLALLVPALPALAEVDAKCAKEWNEAVEIELIGARCKWLDAQKTQAVGGALTRRSACFTANVTPEVAQHHMDLQKQTKAKLTEKFASMDCSSAARGYFDKKYAELAAAR